MSDELKYLYTVSDEKEIAEYRDFALALEDLMKGYIHHLQTNFAVEDFPKYLILANLESATKALSNLPIPAYTNDRRIVLTPSLAVWRDIYLRQLEHYELTTESEATYKTIKTYYQNSLSQNHIFQLIGHELMHHSEWFLDDFEDERASGIWFEEGMAEYVSKKFFLTAKEYELEKKVNRLLVDMFEEEYGKPSLEDFGESTYEGGYAEIFYFYWRSFLTVDQLLERYGNVRAVFEVYHAWDTEGRRTNLAQYFGLEG